MAFLDNFDKKITQLGQGAFQKTKEVSESMRITGLIKEEEKKQQDIYMAVGRYYMENINENVTGILEDWHTQMEEIKYRIAQYKEQLRLLKGVSVCPNCHAEISNNAMFCSSCGAKLDYEPSEKECIVNQTKVCSQCGAALKEDQAFCGECGNKIN